MHIMYREILGHFSSETNQGNQKFERIITLKPLEMLFASATTYLTLKLTVTHFHYIYS